MASSDKSAGIWGAALAAAISGAAWWFGTGLAPHAWLTWLAPLPLLLAAPHLRWQWTGLAALLAGACAGLNLWHFMHDVIRLPAVVGLVVAGTPALTCSAAVLLYRRLWLAGHIAGATLSFPALYVAQEYLVSLVSPHGTFGSLAYSQMDALSVIQLASLAGIWGVTFVVMLVPAALAVALQRGPSPAQRLFAGGGALLVVASTFAFAYVRLQAPTAGSVRVGLVSLQGPVRPALNSADGRALLQRYLKAIDILSAQGAQAVVLPETAFGLDGTGIPELAERAARGRLVIDVGAASEDRSHAGRNMSLAFSPGVPEPVAYAKRHLIPGFESQYQPGSAHAMLPGTRTGLAICKDMDFHDTGSSYAARDANLLLVPAWDFGDDGWLHSRMAIMRGIESGFAIARTARRGRLTLSDDRGRVVAETSDANGDAVLVGDLPLHQSHTLYARWGDWFAWIDLALLAALFLRACMLQGPKRRTWGIKPLARG
jgi:apolipoprotein N-acyltransferase